MKKKLIKNKKKLFLLVSFFLIVTFVLCGCIKIRTKEKTTENKDKENVVENNIVTENNANSKLQEASNSNDNNSTEAAYQSLVEKNNYYVECSNDLSDSTIKSYNRYLSWANKDMGPTGKETNIYGLFELSDGMSCKEGINKAKTTGRSIPDLEKAADEFINAFIELEPLAVEAYAYYQQKNYEDDGMAKGKELHSKLIFSFDKFSIANNKFNEELDKLVAELDTEELSRLEKSGQKAQYLSTKALVLANKINKQGNVDDFHQIEINSFTEKVNEYEKNYNEMKDYAEKNKTEIDDYFGYGSFVTEAERFLTSSKQLMRRVRDKQEYDTGEKMILENEAGAWMVEGSPAALLNSYNRLIDSSNNLDFNFMNF